MKVVKTFEVVRKFLGWSYQEVSVKSGKYSPEYLKQVHEGRPFPGVEKELIMTYIRGLAEMAVNLAFGGKVQGGLHEKLVAQFTEVVRQNNLGLEGVKALVEEVSKDRTLARKLRTQTMDVDVNIDIDWEGTLEEIVLRLNRPDQGDMFGVIGEDAEGSNLPVSDGGSTTSYHYQTRQISAEIEANAQCPNCGNIQSEAQGCRCVQCGYGSIANPNW